MLLYSSLTYTLQGDALRMLAGTMSQILGAIILIAILLPWFLIPVVSILFIYYWAALFYRSSARELKRLGKCNLSLEK